MFANWPLMIKSAVVMAVGIFFIASVTLEDNFALQKNDTFEQIDSVADLNPEEGILKIETEHIEKLEPHQHNHGDSLMSKSHHKTVYSDIYYAPEDVWVTGYEINMHNAPLTVVHHITLFQPGVPDPACPFPYSKILLTAGQDNMQDPSVYLPPPYGVLIKKGEPLQLLAMVHNPLPPVGDGGTHEDVYVTIRLHTEPVAKSQRNLKAEFYLMYLQEKASCNPDDQVFTVPPHAENFSYKQDLTKDSTPGVSTFESDGEIIFAGSHLHGWEGGKQINLYINDELYKEYRTNLVEGEKYTWESEQGLVSIPINKGDRVSIEAIYSNPHEQPVIGAMGMYGFFFAPNKSR